MAWDLICDVVQVLVCISTFKSNCTRKLEYRCDIFISLIGTSMRDETCVIDMRTDRKKQQIYLSLQDSEIDYHFHYSLFTVSLIVAATYFCDFSLAAFVRFMVNTPCFFCWFCLRCCVTLVVVCVKIFSWVRTNQIYVQLIKNSVWYLCWLLGTLCINIFCMFHDGQGEFVRSIRKVCVITYNQKHHCLY